MKRFLAAVLFAVTISLHAQTSPSDIRPSVAVIPENPRPGEPVTIALEADAFPGYTVTRAVLHKPNGDGLSSARFFDIDIDGGRFRAAVIACPSTTKSGAASIRLEGRVTATGIAGPHTGSTSGITELPVTITERSFDSEIIPLDEKLTAIRAEPDPRKTKEAEEIWAIYLHNGDTVYSDGAFTPPVTSTRRTSRFGDRRVFRYADGKDATSIHAGVDYGVPTGTPVKACAAGKVVMAKNRIVTGNSVVVEHLPGVYSLYFHLDSIAVTEGRTVAAGDLIGLSGATGLATGPHLHWEVRVSGENTDPDAFTVRPVLDKNAIISILK